MSNYEKAKKCIDQFVHDWNKTTLCDLEKWSTEEILIQGAAHMALYFLDFSDYHRLKEYVYAEYGYDIGGIE